MLWYFSSFREFEVGNLGVYTGRIDTHTHAIIFAQTKGMVVTDLTRSHLYRIIVNKVILYSHRAHCDTCMFELINFDMWWIQYLSKHFSYVPHMVYYMLEHVLHRFGYVQTILEHPHDFLIKWQPARRWVNIAYNILLLWLV